MLARATAVLTATMLCCVVSTAGAAVTSYSQNFEGLVMTDPDALANDGWFVYGNVYYPDTTWFYGYGAFPAPNHSLAFCQIDSGQGGPSQGVQQLVVFSDYENTDHDTTGYLIESNVFREYTIEASDVGTGWRFSFDAKLGNIEKNSTATAFIKTIDPLSGYAMTNFINEDMTSIPGTWNRYNLCIEIDEGLVGQLLQVGFMNLAKDYEGSGIYYDNLQLSPDAMDVPSGSAVAKVRMGQNYPNPFNPNTRIDFALEQPGTVEIAVFDISGRRVATLVDGETAAGEHHVTWDGRTDRGNPAVSGVYLYVLRTPADQVARRMMLVR